MSQGQLINATQRLKDQSIANGDKQATHKLLQNISMETQRGNIASILGTLPTPK